MLDRPNIDPEELIARRGMEGERVEFKATWDAKVTGPQVLRTLSAYANDLHNVNGGWVVLGVAEQDSQAVLPPAGLTAAQIDEASAWIRGNCNRIEPAVQPRLFDALVQDRRVLVAWMPASDARPHRAPDPRNPERKEYFVRTGAGDIIAQGAVLDALHQMTARVPWDSRRALDRTVADIHVNLVREFLREEGSRLAEERDDLTLLRRMDLIGRVNGHEVPLNVALLFFSDDPSRHVRCAYIDVAVFPTDRTAGLVDRREVRGPLHHQIRTVVTWIEQQYGTQIAKRDDQMEAETWEVYPGRALTEALANAVFHRSYEGVNEPTMVEVHADRIEIISFPGPLPGLRVEHVLPDATVPHLMGRNRRIGELLRRVHLAELYRFGIQKIYDAMKRNGSPMPTIDWPDDRSSFRVVLPCHHRYLVRSTIQTAATLRARGEHEQALRVLAAAHRSTPGSLPLTLELVGGLCQARRETEALAVFHAFRATSPEAVAPVAALLARTLADLHYLPEAHEVLDAVPAVLRPADAIALAGIETRIGRFARATALFEQAGDSVHADLEGLHAFARARLGLAETLRGARTRGDRERRRAQVSEAERLLHLVLAHPSGARLHGWAWYDLARALKLRRAPRSEVIAALTSASALATADPRLRRAIDEL